jgi:hypothetical protein
MFEELISNKYFVIALIIALIVVLYLYSQKKSCEIEGMKNVDLTPLPQNLVEHPWTNDFNQHYKHVNNAFDKKADAETRKRLGDVTFAPRADQTFERQLESEDDEEIEELRRKILKRRAMKTMKTMKNRHPRPLDLRPDLSQCQPCICPGGKKGITLDSDSDDDDEYESGYLLARNKKN